MQQWFLSVGIVLFCVAANFRDAAGQVRWIYGAAMYGGNLIPRVEVESDVWLEGWLSPEDQDQECDEGGDLVGFTLTPLSPISEPIWLKLYVGQEWEVGELYGVVFDGESGPAPWSFQVPESDCELWATARIYAVLATTDYPEGVARGKILLYTNESPVVQNSWGEIKRRYQLNDSP